MATDPALGLSHTVAESSLGYLAMGAVHATQGEPGHGRAVELERALCRSRQRLDRAEARGPPWSWCMLQAAATVLADLGDRAGPAPCSARPGRS